MKFGKLLVAVIIAGLLLVSLPGVSFARDRVVVDKLPDSGWVPLELKNFSALDPDIEPSSNVTVDRIYYRILKQDRKGTYFLSEDVQLFMNAFSASLQHGFLTGWDKGNKWTVLSDEKNLHGCDSIWIGQKAFLLDDQTVALRDKASCVHGPLKIAVEIQYKKGDQPGESVVDIVKRLLKSNAKQVQ
jgi:hypothetical protein